MDFIKSKLFLSVLFLGVAAFIIGGATMSWFMDDAVLEAAEFRAGTVEISAIEENEDGEPYPIIRMPEMNLDNVNPGDCATVTWEFVNEGTKDVQLKVKLTEKWSSPNLEVKNVYLCPIDPVGGKGWVMGEGHENGNEGEIWLYYVDWTCDEPGSVPGTFSAEDPEDRTVQLKVVVVFDKEDINNDYQGETYTLGGEESAVYAIQASNDAPNKEWDDPDTNWNEWEIVSAKDYELKDWKNEYPEAWSNYDYFHNDDKPGKFTECWIRANGGENKAEIKSFSSHLVAAAPGNLGDNDKDTKINGHFRNAKDQFGNSFTGWVKATFTVYDQRDRTKSGTLTRYIEFENGSAQLSQTDPRLVIKGIYTRNNKDISVTINGITQ